METETTTNGTENKGADWEAAAAEAAEHVATERQEAMKPRRFEELLPCKLTDAEKIERGEQLSAALAVVDTISAERKTANDAFKARTTLALERVTELREAIDTEQEERNVECVESFELRLGCARTVRTDTGEYIRERALRQSELQPELPMSNSENGHGTQMNLGDVDPTDTTDPDALLKAAQQGEEATESNATLENDLDEDEDSAVDEDEDGQ